MKNKGCDVGCIIFLSFILVMFSTIPLSNAATISGTVFKEDGSSPVNDATIAVNVYNGLPCVSHQLVAQGTSGNGAFAITGLSPGTYYLKAVNVSGTSNYIDEWWASTNSIWDCWGAEAITINSSGDILSNKNFQLDRYGSISGSVYDANGIPITDSQILDVNAFRGSSCTSSEYIGVSTTVGISTYTIDKVPPGTYYVKSYNKGAVWFIDEYHTVSGSTNNGVSYLCESAAPVTVSSGMDTPDIDFQLNSGGRISGTVYKSDGTTPVTDADIHVFALEGGSCEGGTYVDGTRTSSGDYIIAGIPAGNYYIQANRVSGANYLGEWYNNPASSSNCNDADVVQVWVGEETKDRHFQLDSGGSIFGKLVDESGQPLGNVEINCNSAEQVYQAFSNPADGTFTVYGLGPGKSNIRIISDPGRYLAGFRRNYYLTQGENKDIGTLTVPKGAVINGMVTKNSVPLQQFELSAEAKLTMAKVYTGADGTFSFVLPPGEFTIVTYDSMGPVTTVPQKVVVTETDKMTTKSIPTIAAYDLSNGDVYNGTVTINNSPPTGAGVMIMSFMNNQEYDLNNWGATSPFGIAGLFDGSTVSNPYQLATPSGSSIQLCLVLYKSLSDENETITLKNFVSGLTGGGTYNFTYNNIGSMVDGYVTRNGEPVFWASVALYSQPGNEFVGFARTDHTGYYVLYNIPNGTYGFEATAEDFNGIYKTPDFNLNGNLSMNIALSELAGTSGDINSDQNVDLSDAILAIKVIAGLNPLGVNSNADVDGDKKIGLAEPMYILQTVAGLRITDAILPTEQWSTVVDGGQGSGQWTFSENNDSSFTTDGYWDYNYNGWAVNCPFTQGQVTVTGNSFSFTATGTATASGAPLGYDSSSFTLNVSGTTSNGTANGNYTIYFSTSGWPSSLSGTWTGTRTSGGGITQ